MMIVKSPISVAIPESCDVHLVIPTSLHGWLASQSPHMLGHSWALPVSLHETSLSQPERSGTVQGSMVAFVSHTKAETVRAGSKYSEIVSFFEGSSVFARDTIVNSRSPRGSSFLIPGCALGETVISTGIVNSWSKIVSCVSCLSLVLRGLTGV